MPKEGTVHHKIDLKRTTGSAAHSEHQLSAIRAELHQQRRFRIEQLDELGVDAAEAVAAGDEPRRQVTYALRLAARSALAAIDAALRRLDEGSYGTCERCAEPIPWGRLEVLPMTGLCTDCQFRAESEQSNGSRRHPYLS
jgi:DnaK suppressor protein